MSFDKKLLIKKLIPVYLTGAYLMWLIYFIMDKGNMKDVKIISMQIILFQLSIVGVGLYYTLYKNWHIAKNLLSIGIATTATIKEVSFVSLNLFGSRCVRISYYFSDHFGNQYSRTHLFNKKYIRKWFNGAVPTVGASIGVFYDPANPEHNMLSQEIAYGKTSSTF